MNIKQVNGNTTIEFSDDELKVLNKTKKLTFDPINSRHFFNSLMHMLIKLDKGLPEDVKVGTPLDEIKNPKGLDIDATDT